ncbi:aminopeptidase P family protein [Collinsella tanakaei]|uniref:M24 family metallopeptidase n=1 Tax=Collinsella ihumii TaxID=1720204 RepID=UPI00195B11CB|nr:Xaa-Pro peptidase family protein [Collinsella ihumii]MBM6775859.1 aminopeptidase P family protein [Collinsella tanakaei]MBM6784957.1 aminopeptidase P family protein [Collinsella tanakaei]MBM6904945.1 aminopeptidase P family protein [Collinsella tanakaei]MDN0054871.1 Xaa-Pro peptidase family protein [Collinsella ihumii]
MTDIQNGPAGRIARLRSLMEERGYDAVVVRDEANLRWLTGAMGVFDYTFEFPHAAFITHDACYLHTDSRYFNSFAENMPEGSPWQIDMDGFDIPGWVAQRALETRSRTIAIEDDMQLSFYQGILRGLEDRSIAASLPQMHGDIRRMRAIKDAEEIELMRHAQAITDLAFQHMLDYIKPGLTEKQIRTELESFMFNNGADSLAFGSIVASGPNTANPHAVPSDRVVQKGDFVLMDYGAGYRDYRSDMTRTVVLGEPTDEQRKIYDLVQRTHEECVKAIHGGVDGRDIHNLSVKIISDAGYGDYYGHGLGHGVGIDIHELPNFGRRSNIVEAGAVITVEPGVYLPGVGGVRLEDYGLVTEDGFEPFTASPHELQIIDC